MDLVPLISDWLKGKHITIDGKVYVFPHGVDKIRKLYNGTEV
jgi:hypothetical protein